ncbi:MAG: hypothetical protein ACM3X9_10835 [Bacillota bacterium]
MADWDQSRYIAANPGNFHHSLEEVDRYFAFCLIDNLIVPWMPSKKMRQWWQVISLSMEIGYVNPNNLGISLKF